MRGVPVRKILLVVVLALTLSFCSFSAAWADDVHLFVNGQEVKSDVAPQVIDGRTMVPLRAVAESLGANVQWDASSKTVSVTDTSAEQDAELAKLWLSSTYNAAELIQNSVVALCASASAVYFLTPSSNSQPGVGTSITNAFQKAFSNISTCQNLYLTSQSANDTWTTLAAEYGSAVPVDKIKSLMQDSLSESSAALTEFQNEYYGGTLTTSCPLATQDLNQANTDVQVAAALLSNSNLQDVPAQ